MLLKLKGSDLLDVKYDFDFDKGCETCDYGSNYLSEVTFIFNNAKMIVKAEQMYEFPINEGRLMKWLLSENEEISKMTLKQFSENFKKAIIDEKVSDEYDSVSGVEITIKMEL